MDSSVDFSKLKVLDLKRELKQRGLNTNGNKNELIERLQESMKSSSLELNSTSLESYILEDVLLNDDDDDHQTAETVLDSDVEKVLDDFSTTSSQLSKYENSPPENGVDKKPKKIKLQRDIPFVEEKSNNGKINDDYTIEETISEEKPKVIKLSGMSVKERLEMRAKKFGTQISGTAKLQARAERFNSLDSDKPKDLDKLKKRAERFGVSSPDIALKDKLEARKARFAMNK